ncbi:MAG: carotenoid oxygenase family protein [Hyphomonadaceae bacterium]|nr:carotenoid oxygenase family protein [Hyphomonadaceae bacterium]
MTLTTSLSRRMLLGSGLAAGAALTLAPRAFAAPEAPEWTLGFTTAPAKGFGPAPMRLVSGKAPAGLEGALYRNGPAQFRYGDSLASHWFDADGMVHRVAIANGKAVHTGRYVQTKKRKAEQEAKKFLASGFGTLGDPSYEVGSSDDVNAANTSVVMSGGEMLALWEGGSAFRLDPVTLETRGPKIWRPDLAAMPFLAHPKREPGGRLWNLAVGGLASGIPKVGIYRIGADGALEDFGIVDVGVLSYIHDWSMTTSKLIILVQPWISTAPRPPFINSFDWRPQDGMKVLIIDKDDLTKQRWVQADARAFYHTGAAWEESDGTIRLDAAFYAEPVLGQGGGADWIRGEYGKPMAEGYLSQLVIPPPNAKAPGDAKYVSTGVGGEFPQVDPRRHGASRRLTALVGGGAPGRPAPTALAVHDWGSSKTDAYDFGKNYMVEEHLFIPKPGKTAEQDSWLIGTAINLRAGHSEVWVFDAAKVSDGPVAVWQADYAWPLGFHGTWAG